MIDCVDLMEMKDLRKALEKNKEVERGEKERL